MKSRIIFLVIFIGSFHSFAQPRSMRKLPNPVNQSAFNCYAPYISMDGNSIVYLNDYTDDGTLAMQYCRKAGADWSTPVTMPRNFSSAINFIKGFTLSPDGQTLYLTSQLSNGVGGFDILAASLKGNTFAEPVNIGMPVNSKKHDGSPSLSADGLSLYFMRCESMNSQKADKCKLMVSRRQPGGRWSEPTELPAHLNTGNSQSPRIMADGETLIFSSSTLQPNKGGMDLYMSRWDGKTWSNPQSMDFVNTAQDDQFVSATSQGQYLLRDTKGDRKTEIIEYLFPKELKPKAILRVDGKLLDPAIPAYVSVTNLSSGQRIYNGRPLADGSFTTFLVEGSKYEVSIEPENSSYTFSSRFFDLSKGVTRPFERYTTQLQQIAANDEIILSAITFKPFTSEVEPTSQNELRRLSRLLKNNPTMKAEIQVLLQGYVQDSIQSNPDLTEITVDSVEYYIEDIDSLGQKIQRDTVVAETTFHNNRTSKQAEAIVKQLISQGCEPGALMTFVNARPEAVLEERKIIVKAVLRKK